MAMFNITSARGMRMSQREPILVLADILEKEMSLKPEQVLLYNQKVKLKPNFDIYISLAVSGASKPIGNTRRYQSTQSGLKEIQTLSLYDVFNLEIFSRGSAARVRRNEVLLALGSTFSLQMQEKYGLRIDPLGPMNDVSELEGTAILNRYVLNIGVYSTVTKEKEVEYYDQFRLQLITDPKREVKDIEIKGDKKV